VLANKAGNSDWATRSWWRSAAESDGIPSCTAPHTQGPPAAATDDAAADGG
jgi:hypothetical protein